SRAARLPPFLHSLDALLDFSLQRRIEREGALEIPFGFGVLTLSQKGQPAVPVSRSEARVEFDGATEFADPAIQFISVARHHPAAVVARGETRIDRHSF